MVLETERLCLREMTREDYPDLCKILQDPEVMYAYEHVFSDEEARLAGKQPVAVHTFVKHYCGMDMPHLVFSVRREEK